MANIMEAIWWTIKESLWFWDSETKERLIWIKKQIAQEYVDKLEKNHSDIISSKESIVSYLANEWSIEDVFMDLFREIWLTILAPSEVENIKIIKEKLSNIEEIPDDTQLSVLKNEIIDSISNNTQNQQNNTSTPVQEKINISHSIENENQFINNVYKKAADQIGTKYTRWWRTPEWWFDCSWLWYRAFKQEGIQFTQRLTAATFSDANINITKDQVKIWDFMFRDQKPWQKKHSPIYHIEMVISKPYTKNGKTYVRTLWSSTDTKDDLSNYVGDGVRVREREMKDFRHYGRPTYYYQLAQHQESGNKTDLLAWINKPSSEMIDKIITA